MRYLMVFALVLVCCTSCEQDSRIKRQAALVNTKTQVTADEFNKADTPEKKVSIATEFFRTAPRMTQVLDDYMCGREPAPDTSAPAPAAAATTTPARDAVPVDVKPK